MYSVCVCVCDCVYLLSVLSVCVRDYVTVCLCICVRDCECVGSPAGGNRSAKRRRRGTEWW